jgi:hypothetical protein
MQVNQEGLALSARQKRPSDLPGTNDLLSESATMQP